MSSYARAGVDISEADAGVAAIVSVLQTIDPGREKLSRVSSGQYASVLEIAPNVGVAITTDGVGSKLIVAEQTGRFDTVGIDCVAMSVNDLICIGAKPLALLDYIAVEQAMPEMLTAVAEGLKVGAELAGVEIPGGELAQLPELVRGHPSPNGFDLVGSCFGTIAVDRIINGSKIVPGDVVIGVPSSGVHSNGLTLARKALLDDGGLTLDSKPQELGGQSIADALLQPTAIYVRAVLELLDQGLDIHGMAHITGGGLTNLLRLTKQHGFLIDQPLKPQAVYDLIAKLGSVELSEMYKAFNMGMGLAVVLPADQAQQATDLLAAHHAGTKPVGQVVEGSNQVSVPSLELNF